MTEAIFFDAVGTLFYLTKTVGDHYALVGSDVGLTLDAQQLDRAFFTAWKQMPERPAIDGPRENDDKGWWRELVDLVLNQVAPSLSEMDRDNLFEIAYEHFAEAGSGSFIRKFSMFWKIAAAISTRCHLKLRRTLAFHSRAPRHLEIFHTYLHFERNRSGQARSRNLSTRAEGCRSQSRSGLAHW
jgi:hypothetical protein